MRALPPGSGLPRPGGRPAAVTRRRRALSRLQPVTEQTPSSIRPLSFLDAFAHLPGVLPGDLGPGPHRATRFPCPPRPRDFRGQSHVRHRAPFAGIPDESRRRLERTDPHRDTGHHHQRCNHPLTPPPTPACRPGRGSAAPPSSRGLFSRRIVGWATSSRTGHRLRARRPGAGDPVLGR